MSESGLEPMFQALSGPGFLGTRAPLFSDIVVVALAVVMALLAAGVALARRRRFGWHGATMTTTWAMLSVVVVAFVEWNERGGPPSAPRLEASAIHGSFYLPLLAVHISVAFTSLVVVPAVAALGVLRRRRPAPGGRLGRLAMRHVRLGRWTLAMLLFTAVSGLAIYGLRYVY